MRVDAFVVAEIEQVRVAGGQRQAEPAGSLGGDAVGEAHGPLRAVVVPGPEEACPGAEAPVDRFGVEESELSQVEDRVLLMGTDQADEVVENLAHADGRQATAGAHQFAHRLGGWFVLEEGEDRIGIEDRQGRRRSSAASARRAARRADRGSLGLEMTGAAKGP